MSQRGANHVEPRLARQDRLPPQEPLKLLLLTRQEHLLSAVIRLKLVIVDVQSVKSIPQSQKISSTITDPRRGSLQPNLSSARRSSMRSRSQNISEYRVHFPSRLILLL